MLDFREVDIFWHGGVVMVMEGKINVEIKYCVP